ncbi:MAG: M42 family peptidase [Oscillospiraceae bacterium]|nr:M42 family peptidase [Oscillospiraceae bacterium]
MLNLLKQLCALSGVSSWEDEVRDFIRAKAEPYADSIRMDTIGNLIVFKKGKKPTGNKLLLSAHMDEVGLMVKRVEEDGTLRFDTVGGIDRRILIGKTVYVGQSHLPGIIGSKPIHLTSRDERRQAPKLDKLYLDIGARDQAEAERYVRPGDIITFGPEWQEFGNGLLKAKAIDDRVGCAVMLKLLEEELPLDCNFVFSCQEEVGTRGAFGYSFALRPEIAMILEGTTAADLPGVREDQKVCVPGDGPVISLVDGGTMYDRELFETLRDLADAHGIPWQVKRMVAGGTDARTIQRSRAGVRVTGLSDAVRYIHSPSSVAAISDLDSILKLARLFLQRVAEEA